MSRLCARKPSAMNTPSAVFYGSNYIPYQPPCRSPNRLVPQVIIPPPQHPSSPSPAPVRPIRQTPRAPSRGHTAAQPSALPRDDARNPKYIPSECGLGYRMPTPDDTVRPPAPPFKGQGARLATIPQRVWRVSLVSVVAFAVLGACLGLALSRYRDGPTKIATTTGALSPATGTQCSRIVRGRQASVHFIVNTELPPERSAYSAPIVPATMENR